MKPFVWSTLGMIGIWAILFSYQFLIAGIPPGQEEEWGVIANAKVITEIILFNALIWFGPKYN